MTKLPEAYHVVGLERLMDRTEGNPSVRIGVIDGPARLTHPDIARDNVIVSGNGAEWDCVNPQSEACRHGTFVLGSLAARRDAEVPGICPGCTFILRPIFCEASSVRDCPVVSSADLASHVAALVDSGVDILNLSLGSDSIDGKVNPQLYRAYDVARERGVLIIGASGNQGALRVNPALRHPWVINVAAASTTGAPHPQSNVDSSSTVHAPGVDVIGLASVGGTTTMTGSSVAAPFVTGAAALLWSFQRRLSAEQLRKIIISSKDSATDMFNAEIAYQRINPTARVVGAVEPPPPKPRLADAVALQAVANDETKDPEPALQPQACSCSSAPPAGFAYSIGTVRPVFPEEGLRKEYEFAASQLRVSPTDYYAVLSNQTYTYIAQEACWILDINNVDSFILHPRSGTELKDLVEAIKPVTAGSVEKPMSVIIGPIYPDKPYPRCPNLHLPVVVTNQVYYFDFDTLIKNLTAKNIQVESVRSVLEALKLKANEGVSDSDRALNYIAFRFPEMYRKADQMKVNQLPGFFLISISTQPSSTPGNRKVVDVIYKYQQYDTGEQQWFYCAIDVTGQFPFLQTALQPFVPTS
jgi:subtilase family protein/cyclic patellamide precursor peptide PatG